MTWFKVDDGLAFHPKTLAAGNMAMGLWVRAGAWCMANLTDGHLPRAMISPLDGRKRDADRLVEAQLWTRVDGGYQFVDWEQWQPTKVQVTANREATKERVSRWREGRSNAVTNAVSNTVGNAVSTPSPSRPVPSLSGLGSQSLEGSSANGSSGLDLDKIATELGQPKTWAARVSRDVLSRADQVSNQTTYVLAAIRGEPQRYQPTNGPPPINRLCDHGRDRLTCRDCEEP